ncbi:MAG: cytidylate kinase-like family protein [Oscillospiraceae bacterium]|nr:cytidylate kinase-like family protein [Oscillospiraceae bacterium]
MGTKIITISRQFGSGGRSIGREVAERLGIPFYDKELVEQVALESGFAPSFVEENGEHSPTRSRLAYAFSHQSIPGVMNGMSIADFLWSVQCNVIMQLADKGPCVIVGRNADYILKDRKDCLDVFIHADTDFRADRIVRLYGESEKSPVARLNEKDKRRMINYQHYTGRVWGQSENYDLCLNSGELGIETCVELIVAAATK